MPSRKSQLKVERARLEWKLKLITCNDASDVFINVFTNTVYKHTLELKPGGGTQLILRD